MTDLGLVGKHQLNDKVNLTQIIQSAKKTDEDDLIFGQIKEGCLGSDLYYEAHEHKNTVRLQNLLRYLFIQRYGLKVIELLTENFE